MTDQLIIDGDELTVTSPEEKVEEVQEAPKKEKGTLLQRFHKHAGELDITPKQMHQLRERLLSERGVEVADFTKKRISSITKKAKRKQQRKSRRANR